MRRHILDTLRSDVRLDDQCFLKNWLAHINSPDMRDHALKLVLSSVGD